MPGVPINEAIRALRKKYGKPAPPAITDPLEMILHENVAYLVADEVRDAVWAAFKKSVGVDPKRILRAGKMKIAGVIEKGGMHPLRRAQKVMEVARVVVEECGGDLGKALKGSPRKARRALKSFPGIGDPGADKVLLFTRTEAVPALESNGVRVLARLGYCDEDDGYAKQHRDATRALRAGLVQEFEPLTEAYQLLREHGKETCVRMGPRCDECPLAKMGCPVGRARLGLVSR